MILGVGTDIIEIDRIKRAMDNTSGFLERIFTDKEMFGQRCQGNIFFVIGVNVVADFPDHILVHLYILWRQIQTHT